MRTLVSLFISSLFSSLLYSQSVSTSTTYTVGNIDTEFAGAFNQDTSNESACAGLLNVSIPAGRFVTSIDVAYQGQALGGGWLSEQFSYLECVTTGTKEDDVSNGPPINTTGTFNYNRTGLTIANGTVPTGGLDFKLHAFRTFSNNPSCGQQVNRINNNSWTVTVHHIPPPSCFNPSNVSVSNIQSNSVDVSWLTGGASSWQIEYGPQGFTPGTGTLVGTNSNPYTLTGLSPQTTYSLRVRDSCGVGDVSIWTPVAVSFTTACTSVTAPWSENFDSGTWLVGTGFGNRGTIDTCWQRNWSNGFTMKPGPPQFSSAFSGPSGDHTTGSGKYLYSEVFQFTALPLVAQIESPLIDLSSLTVPELTFWYHMFGFNVDQLDVEVSNNGGSSWTNVFNRTGQLQTAKTDPWREVIVNLSAYANQTIKLRFVVTQNTFGTNGDVAIDDVAIREAPTCPRPQNLSEIFVWTNRAQLGWTTGGASNWQIEYGPAGFTPGNGTLINVNSNPTSVTGLSPATTYDFYVRDSCGIGDVSQWTGPLRLKTRCAAFSTPYVQAFSGAAYSAGPTFNDTGSIGPCFDRDQLTNYVWKGGPPTFSPFNTGPSGDHTTGSGKYVFAQAIGFGGGSARETNLQSVVIDLTPLTNPQLTFWYHMFGADINELSVRITSGNGIWNLERQIVGQQQTAKADPWNEVIIDLSAYAGDSIIIEWRANASPTGTASHIALDDVNVDEAPSCPKPQNLTVVTTSNNSATLNWIPGGVATNWVIEYGPPGFTLGNGTQVVATTQPFTVTGLSANTAYEFYVQDSCGVGDVSVWTGPAGDTTDCIAVSAPWVEDFESSLWQLGTFTTPGNIDPCWNRQPGGNYIWTTGQNGTQSFNTGPSVDHTLGNSSGKFLYSEGFFGFNQSRVGVIETPLIDLSPLNVPEFTFWYHMFGQQIDSLVVEVSDGVSWTREFSLAGAQQTSSAAAWKEAILDFSSYANNTIKIRFTAYKASNFAQSIDIAIDDLDIHEKPLCPKPTNLAVSSVGANSITLDWTSGGATDWQIEYGPIGFTLGSGTLINVPTNPFTVTGLASSTAYEFYVRDSCGIANVSDWSTSAAATTACLPLSAPWNENFDASNFAPPVTFTDTGIVDNCWNRSPLDDYLWMVGEVLFPTPNTGPSADHTTGNGNYMVTETIGFAPLPSTALLETPLIDLSPLNVPELSFWYHMFGFNIGDLVVEIDNGSGYTAIDTISGEQQSASTDAWLESIQDLSAYADDTVRIRFKAIKFQNGVLSDIAIDDVDIHEQPSCPKPQDLNLVSAQANSLTISWTSGGATNWQIRYRQSGTSGPYTVIPATTNPFTISGLNASTSYEISVLDSCGVGDISEWSASENFVTTCGVIVAPWTENFDNSPWISGTGANNFGDQINSCWTRSATIPNWGTRTGGTTSGNTGPTADASGSGNYIYREASFGGNGVGVITTPDIAIPTTMTAPQLYFSYHMCGTNIDSLSIKVEDLSGTKVARISYIGPQQPTEASPWIPDSLDISNFIGDTVIVTFTGVNSGFIGDIAVDEVRIDENPLCNDPTGLSLTAISPDSIEVTWSSEKPTSNLIFYKFQDGPSVSVFLTGMTSPATIFGLDPNTTYGFGIFDSCGLPFLVSDTIIDTISTLPCPPLTTNATFTNNWLNVAFDASTSVNADSLLWLFGDNTFANGVSPSHTYATPGIYTVSLLSWTDCGLRDTLLFDVEVCDSLDASFSDTRNNLTVNLNSTSLNADSTYWSFGDGNSANTPTTIHTYAAQGTYTIWLYAYNNCGNVDSISTLVQVCDTLKVDFSYTRSGDTLFFDASASSGYNQLTWSFGDGTGASTVLSTHYYSDPGLYTITLTVSNACGDTLVTSQNVQLCLMPVPTWTYTLLGTTSNGMEIQFDGSASQNSSIYRWDFGDGSGIVGPVAPVHTYLIPSLNYRVTLTTENGCGDRRSYSYRLSEIGLDEVSVNERIDIYPNPASDRLIISWESEYSEPLELHLFDMQGRELLNRLVSREEQSQGSLEWKLDYLPNGAYLLRVQGEGMDIPHRLMIRN